MTEQMLPQPLVVDLTTLVRTMHEWRIARMALPRRYNAYVAVYHRLLLREAPDSLWVPASERMIAIASRLVGLLADGR